MKVINNEILFIYRAIINHYIPKIDNWLEKNNVTTPTGEEVIILRLLIYLNLHLENIIC